MASSWWMLSAWFITALAASRRDVRLRGQAAAIIFPSLARQFAGEGAELLDGRHPVVLTIWRFAGVYRAGGVPVLADLPDETIAPSSIHHRRIDATHPPDRTTGEDCPSPRTHPSTPRIRRFVFPS